MRSRPDNAVLYPDAATATATAIAIVRAQHAIPK
jgi:hypothetical protein